MATKATKGVTIQNISKIYISPDKTEFKAVDNISVDIAPGEFVTLLGPSGCGKSTTLRMIAGFEVPSQGSLYLGDECIDELSPDKRDTAMVFQSYAIFPHLNVYDNIAYGLKINKVPKDEIARRVGDIIELVGLTGMERRAPSQISGGQQQRVALARALVIQPGVLLFDEPLSNLDAKLRLYMRTEIKKIQQRVGITAIYVTHDQAEAMSLSDRIIIMNKGEIEQIGSPQEVYYKPKTRFVAEFIGVANFLDLTLVKPLDGKGVFRVGDGEITCDYHGSKKAGDTVLAMVRPEALTIGKEGLLPATVTRSTFMGTMQEYTVQTGEGTAHEIEIPNPKHRQIFQEGESVLLGFDESDIHIID